MPVLNQESERSCICVLSVLSPSDFLTYYILDIYFKSVFIILYFEYVILIIAILVSVFIKLIEWHAEANI